MARQHQALGLDEDDDDGLKKPREDKSMDQDGSSNKEVVSILKNRRDDRNDINNTRVSGAVGCFAKLTSYGVHQCCLLIQISQQDTLKQLL